MIHLPWSLGATFLCAHARIELGNKFERQSIIPASQRLGYYHDIFAATNSNPSQCTRHSVHFFDLISCDQCTLMVDSEQGLRFIITVLIASMRQSVKKQLILLTGSEINWSKRWVLFFKRIKVCMYN